MKLKIPIYLGALCMTLLCANVGWAIPTLQLDIAGGTYDPNTQTIISVGKTFTLYALLNDPDADLSRNYYISSALVPKTSINSQLGTFSFANQQVDVVGGMTYGTPPLTVLDYVTTPSTDLQSHGIFETYYAEFSFNFTEACKVSSYDSQSNPGTTISQSSSGDMYYAAFSVDTTGLPDGYAIHFDLYDEFVKTIEAKYKKGELINPEIDIITIDNFAPFSHDAQSYLRPVPPDTVVPDGGITLALIGMALAGLGMFRKQAIR